MRFLVLLLLATSCGADRAWLEVCRGGKQFGYDPGRCAAPQTLRWERLPITVFADGLGDYRGSLEAAVNFWNEEIGGAVFILVEDPGADAIVSLAITGFYGDDWPGSDHDERGAARHFVDFENRLRAAVELRRPVDIYDAVPVFTHELGHVLGLDHDSLSGSVMYPRATNGPYCVSSSDRRAILARYF